MPSNRTLNYALSQWERTDKVQMEDFNADNARIDAAIKAEADARAADTAALTAQAAALSAQVAKRGNCQIHTAAYTGDGTFGADAPTFIPYPKVPVLLIVAASDNALFVMTPSMENWDSHISNVGHFYSPMTWTKTGLSIYSERSASFQMNELNLTYTVVAVYQAG